MSRVFVTSIECIGSLIVACSSHDASDESNVGQVALEVATTPSDVQCVVIQATCSGRTVTRPSLALGAVSLGFGHRAAAISIARTDVDAVQIVREDAFVDQSGGP